MRYEDALKKWGALRLEASGSDLSVQLESVTVGFDFNAGYSCCGGRDPDCYCSFAESPSANVVISGESTKGNMLQVFISLEDFDFATVLMEIVRAGGGEISALTDV